MDNNTSSLQLETQIQQARELAINGKMTEAEMAFQSLLSNHPNDPRILSILGAIIFRRGDLLQARQFIEKSLLIDPAQAKSLLNLSAILFNLGEFDSALEIIDRSLALGNPSPETWNNRGIILNALGKHDEALQDLNAALSLNPENIDALYNKGTVLQKITEYDLALACYEQVIAIAPNHNGARYNLAIVQSTLGNQAQALVTLSKLISDKPDFLDALLQRGRVLFELGRTEEALTDTDTLLSFAPDHTGALNLIGTILLQEGKAADALQYFAKVRQITPDDPLNLLGLGVAQFELKDYLGAIESFDSAIALNPSIPEAYNNKGLAYQETKQYEDAIKHYDYALKLRPDYLDALYNKANALRERETFEEALILYEQLLTLAPNHAKGWKNKGATLDKLKRREEALDAYNQVTVLTPDDAEAYFNASTVLVKLNKQEQALRYANKAHKLDPTYVDALYIRALILMNLGVLNHARTDAEEAVRQEPHHALANHILGNIHDELKELDAALACFEIAQAGDRDIEFLPGKIAHHRMHISDWSNFQGSVDQLIAGLDQGRPVCQPFDLHSLIDAPEYHRLAAEIFFDTLLKTTAEVFPARDANKARIHVAYFSSDIGDHPVSALMAGVFEAHDRRHFEITLFSLANNVGATRNRIFHAVEHVINAEFMSDDEIVALARSLKIDIAVDLNGHTSNARTTLFAKRLAPLQLNYIGFLGTMGSDCYDYILGDPVIAPIAHERYFSEKIIHLPFYQANDNSVEVPNTTHTREHYGLPNDGFVFCSFNANYKITPTIFNAWMSILRQVPNSVLWLYCKNETAITNLRAAATTQGIESKRLIIASGVPYLEHLARQRLADLFLDTYPYNAGATASNALYAGLPLITYSGYAFCSRYGASLLTALDLNELVTESLEDYIALSVLLATDDTLYAKLKDKLGRNLKTQPLFNTGAFAKNIETAYQAILDRHLRGLPPAHTPLADTHNN